MQLGNKFMIAGLLAVLVGLSGCASTAIDIPSADATSASNLTVSAGDVVDSAQKAVLLHWSERNQVVYFNSDNQLVLQDVQPNSAPIIVSQKERDGSVLRVYADGVAKEDRLYLAWMEKNTKPIEKKERTGEKYINFSTVGTSGQQVTTAQRISQGGGAFEPRVLALDSPKAVFVVWTDERNGGKFDIFVNVSQNKGATWLPKEIKLTDDSHLFVIDPVIGAVGNHVVVQWMQIDEKGVFQILSRFSSDQGLTWSKATVVYRGENQPISPQLVRVGDNLTSCWATAVGVACSKSVDAGLNWGPWTTIEGTNRVGLIRALADTTGRIHMVVNQRSEDGRTTAIFYAHDDGASNFGPAKLLSREPVYQARAIEPALAVNAKNGVFVAWMDYTFIKPMISATYSADQGQTWSPPHITTVTTNLEEQHFPTAIGKEADTFEYAYLRVKPGRSQWEVRNLDLSQVPRDFDPRPSADALKERVAKYWETRVQKRWADSYDYLDPYYKRVSDKESYAQSQGRVVYYSYSLKDEPLINGVRASVQVIYDSEVPEFMLMGKPVSVPRKEATAAQKWIWLDGEWYLVLEDIMGKSSLPE